MANAVHGRNCTTFVNQFDISNYLNSMSADRDAPELDQTTFLDTAKTYIADFPSGTVSLEGFYSVDTTNNDTAEDVLRAAIGAANRVVTIAPEGAATFGNRALLNDGAEVKHSVGHPVSGLITTMADFRGEVQHGVLLAQKASRTSSGNGTSVDNTTSSANGGVGHIHVFSKSGTTPTLDVKIQHSTDNSTFADLITFTQLTDVGSQRSAVTGTVNRYTRETRTIGGTSTPTFNYAVAFARY